MSVALLSATSFSVVRVADTALSASISGWLAALALIAGMTLSTVCSFLSSVSATSWSPATGAQACAAAEPLPLADLVAAALVPDCPLEPQPDRVRVRSSSPAVPSVPRARCRMVPAFCVPHRRGAGARVLAGQSADPRVPFHLSTRV